MSLKQLLHTKSLKALLANLEEGKGGHSLHRVLGPVALTSLGVGAIIGTGIFVATGAAAHEIAGPSLMVSYMVCGITCIFAALCYAEFAAMAPVAGSAYTYAYATLGEIFAWIIGWDLVLEYAVGSATVANGWSGYFTKIVNSFLGYFFQLKLSDAFTKPPYTFDEVTHAFKPGGYINLPAVIITLIVTIILVRGIKESANFNALMVFIKVAAVLFVILVGAFYINPKNWQPFAPFGWTGVGFFGFPVLGQTNSEHKPVGMLAGAAIIFFSFIGFDSVSTHAEEARNPQKDVPRGIIFSLLICTVLYVAVVAVLTGMVSYTKIDKDAGVASAFKAINLHVAEVIISAAAIAGITSVLLVMMLSAPRVFMAMARDGLVPKKFFAEVHPTFKTPWKSTILIGICVAIMAGLFPIDFLLHLTNIGTLFAFVIVCAAVLIMRKTNPDAKRPFRCPLVPFVPIMGIITCLLLMFSLPFENWLRLFAWLAIGMVIYFSYGMWHSAVGKEMRGEFKLEAPPKEL